MSISERVWQCAALALYGKMSYIEEDFICSACYTSQEAPLTAQRPDDHSILYLMLREEHHQ